MSVRPVIAWIGQMAMLGGPFLRYRIAVQLGVPALLYPKAPAALKALLAAIAMIDDMASVDVGIAADR